MLRATMQVVEWQTGSEIESNKSSRVANGRHALQQEVSVQFRLGEVRDPDDMAVHTKSSRYTLQSTMQYDTLLYLISMKNIFNIKVNIWFIYQILSR